MKAADPLRPSVYLRRNLGKTAPLASVIVLAVLLIAGIISLINSIPLSIKTFYAYSKLYIGATPRGDLTMTPKLKKEFEDKSPVAIDPVMTIRGSYIEVRSIVGKWPFVVLALNQNDMDYYFNRMGSKLVEGRKPKPGEPEAVVSANVARNLGLKIGSVLMSPDMTESYSPYEVKVVGIANGENWFALTSIEYHSANHFPPVDSILVFAKNPADQPKLDAWADKHFAGWRTQLFTYRELEEQADTMFAILYQILNVVIGTLVVVITIMMGMLINIYLGQRVQEFGLLQALGHSKRKILSRVLTETGIVVIGGWVLGLVGSYVLLMVVKRVLMDPNAFALDPMDLSAYMYSLPVPIAIFTVAVATVLHRFRAFDPVGIVERRLV